MQILAAVLFFLASISLANAQGADSPQALATQVRAMIQSKNLARIVELVQPETDPASLANVTSDLVRYMGAENLTVYIVPKDDRTAVDKLLSQSPIPGAFKPLDERVNTYAKAGRFFSIVPLGDLVVSGKQADASSRQSLSTVVYGQHNGRYLIIFAKKKLQP